MIENDFRGGITVTIKDIAQDAGVSVSSVSRYFNNKELLNPETCKKIEASVKKHNYVPNSIGRSLRISRSGKLLAILPSISNPIYQKILSTINAECKKRGYTLLTATTDNNRFMEDHLLSMLETHYVDGVIFFATTLNTDELSKLAKRFPVVFCCESVEANISGVSIDNELAVFEACGFLAQNGHKRIALLSGMPDYSTTLLREHGYRRALKAHGLPFIPEHLIRGQYGFTSGVNAAQKLLETGKLPDGIIATSDAVAIGAVKELSKHGILAGRDLSVIGFDNTSVAAMYRPSISSISQPREEMGRIAAELLFERMNSPKQDTRRVVLKHELIIRNSIIRRNPNEQH